MTGEATSASHDVSTLRDYVSVLRRRKWLVVLPILVVPIAAALLALRQPALYAASAEVLVSQKNLAASLTGTIDPSGAQSPERILQTQADIASVPQVARRVLDHVGLKNRSIDYLLRNSSVSIKENSDLLVFTVGDRVPKTAEALATEYARQFTLYRQRLDTASLVHARKEVEKRLAQLVRQNEQQTPLYASLAEKQEQLKTIEALQTSNAFLVRPARRAVQIQPKPQRNAALGLALGIILGIGLAFLWEALDTRVRTTDEITRRLGLPLLARLPTPSRWMRRANRLVMLVEPNGVAAEAFRILRTNFDFFNLEHGARTVMVTSSVGDEGKSTTAANLAVALARAGQRVILVDLDLRRPMLERFFEFEDQPGVTDVVLGRARLGPALNDRSSSEPGAATNGSLHVLTSGPPPKDPGEFIGGPRLAAVLAELRERADVVLIDAAPLLVVGDGMALSAHIDGVIVVTRLNVVRRQMLSELRRVLANCPARKLGFIVTGADEEDLYGYGYGYGYANPSRYGSEYARTHESRREERQGRR